MELQSASFLTSTINGDKRSTSSHGRLNPGKGHRYALDRALVELQRWFESSKEQIDISPKRRFLSLPFRNLVTMPIILSWLSEFQWHFLYNYYYTYHHHKHQGLDPLIRSVSRVTAVRANATLVVQLFSFLVVCSGMISKGFDFVAFFASMNANSVCIYLSCLVCL